MSGPSKCTILEFPVVVSPSNGPPTASADSYSTNEDTPLTQSAPGVLSNDIDPDGNALTAILVSGPGHAVSFTLNSNGSFSYTAAANYNGSDSFTYKVNDGYVDSNVATASITITPVNDAPLNIAPGAQSTNEETALVFSSGNANEISTADSDAGSNAVKVTLTATHGTLSLAQTIGLTFAAGDGTDDASMIFTGTLADVNTALNGLSYVPTLNYDGAALVSFMTDDQGNSGAGGAQTDTDSVAVTVNQLNDPPIATNDSGYTTAEDETLSASAPGVLGNDTDADANPLTAALVSGPSHAAAFALNADGSFSYAPAADYNGSDSFTYKANDGTVDSTVVTASITVTPVNDAPVNSAPAATQQVNSGSSLVFSSANQISISDLDAGSNAVKVTLSATHGTLSLAQLDGLTFQAGDGTDDASMTFTGTLTDVNAALNGLSYVPNLNYDGPDSVSITTDDQGNIGAGGAQSDTDSVAVTDIAPGDNTAPTVVVSTPVEDGTFNFGEDIPFTISVTDPEDGTVDCSEVTVTFVLGHDTHGHAEAGTTGCSGVLQTVAADVGHGDIVYGVVSASYTDHGGTAGSPPLTTTAQSVIWQKHQEVEFVLNQSGTTTVADTDGGPGPSGNPGIHRASLTNGDWVQLNGPYNLLNIDSLTFRVSDTATRTAGSPMAAIEVHQDSSTGPIVTTCNLVSTGNATTWTSQNFPISLSGTHELFLVFRSVTGGQTGANLLNLNWVEFQGAGIGTFPTS